MGRKQDKGRIFEAVNITDFGAEGKSVGRIGDKVVFVPFTAPGDIVDVRITKSHSSYFEGVAVGWHKLSTDRRVPHCTHFGICGGCKWQHIPYPLQLEMKELQVRHQLQRIGKIDTEKMLPILGADSEYYYRNKLEFAFTDNKWLSEEEIADSHEQYDRRGLGFHVPGRFDRVLDLSECHLQDLLSDEIRRKVRSYSLQNNLPFFNLRHQTGLLRNLTIRNSSTGEWMVLFSFRERPQQKINEFLQHMAEKFMQVDSWLYVINAKGNDTIYDLDIEVFKGRDFYMETLLGLKFKVGIKSFFQTHHAQAVELVSAALEMADIKHGQTLYDLYCGTGTLSLPAAIKGARVSGIESVGEAVSAAQENARLNQIDNAFFEVGDMKDIFNSQFIARHGRPDVVITDPPRAGMHENVVGQLIDLEAPRIIYVSCNPATQARDVSMLSQRYRVSSIQPVDMFPQTHHIENIIQLDLA